MSGKTQRPPAGKPWVWLTRELLESDAWRSAGIGVRRMIDFLILEHMSHGGKENGKLKAPYRQLVVFGIGARFITAHIAEAEKLGLIECHRGGMRVATTYGLTWLPWHDGRPASDRWQLYRNPELAPLPRAKNKNLPAKGDAALPAKGDADDQILPAKGDADRPKNLPAKGDALSIKVLTKSSDTYSELGVGVLGRVEAERGSGSRA